MPTPGKARTKANTRHAMLVAEATPAPGQGTIAHTHEQAQAATAIDTRTVATAEQRRRQQRAAAGSGGLRHNAMMAHQQHRSHGPFTGRLHARRRHHVQTAWLLCVERCQAPVQNIGYSNFLNFTHPQPATSVAVPYSNMVQMPMPAVDIDDAPTENWQRDIVWTVVLAAMAKVCRTQGTPYNQS